MFQSSNVTVCDLVQVILYLEIYSPNHANTFVTFCYHQIWKLLNRKRGLMKHTRCDISFGFLLVKEIN